MSKSISSSLETPPEPFRRGLSPLSLALVFTRFFYFGLDFDFDFDSEPERPPLSFDLLLPSDFFSVLGDLPPS